jgi:cytochrome P450
LPDQVAVERVTSTATSVAFEFDHWSSKMAYSPWDVWSRMRHECPVAWTPSHGGYYVLSRYEDVCAAALDPGTFSSDGNGAGVAVPPQEIRPLYPIELDPPLHTAYRSILNPWLNPHAVAAMEPWVRDLVREHIATFPASGSFDIAEAFTLLVPRMVAFRVLGFPPEDTAEIAALVDQVSTSIDDRQGEAGPRLFAKLSDTVTSRLRNPRQDDLLDAVVFGEIDGVRLDSTQVMAVLILLLFGGLGTTSAALGGMILWLADHPEDRDRLRDHPELFDTAVDEFVRWSTPVAHLGRTAMNDVDVRGCPIPAGARVVLAYGSANRDETHFERPDEVILDRHPNRHAGFGIGRHRCVGSHLARLQMRVALDELLRALPEFHVADHGEIRWVKGETRMICNLPLSVSRAE